MPFSHITTWLFDLDDTLYASVKGIHDQVHSRMSNYVANALKIPLEEAHIVRKDYFKNFGTTLRGLMTEADVDPHDFMDKVHDLDLTPIDKCAIIADALERLKGRKIIFTNAPRIHADRVLTHLDLGHHFEGIYDITGAGFTPKPEPKTYEQIIERFGLDPKTCCFFDDLERNLKPAHDKGMTTVWICGGSDTPDALFDHVHYRAKTLANFFQTRGF